MNNITTSMIMNTLFSFSGLRKPFLATSFLLALPQILLGKLGWLILFLVGAGFLSIALFVYISGLAGSSATDFESEENRADDNNGGIRLGLDTDRDGQADSVDTDDDNDGVKDDSDQCSTGETGWESNSSADNDGDGCRDASEDIDDDGDGLIEIATAAELYAVRYALDGKGRKPSPEAVLNTTGCGGNGGITSCSGYELIANISLATYADADVGKGWQPLGHDTDSSTGECDGPAFDGTFDGNGFMISDLSIRRSDEDCVGLFGHIAAGSKIRNLRLRAEIVRGRNFVGGLVGYSKSAQIFSSLVIAGEVRGGNRVGGLVGGGEETQVFSSSVVVAEVHGTDDVGGLVGDDPSAQIFSSSVVMSMVRGTGNHVGGLVGKGKSARIDSSSVVVGEVRGTDDVGGLVGCGKLTRIAYSYLVSGSNTALVGSGSKAIGIASYWDNETSGRNSGNNGDPKTSDELRRPTDYTGLYADWKEDKDIIDDSKSSNKKIRDKPLVVWCDKDNSGSIEWYEQKDEENRVWDFGTDMEYPAISCTPLTPAEWRSWWSLDRDGKPQLDQTRLYALLLFPN